MATTTGWQRTCTSDYQAQQSTDMRNASSAPNSPKMAAPTSLMPSPQSVYELLTNQLEENPHQPEIWRRLLNIAESSGNMDKISTTYDALLKQYPNTAKAQIQYLIHLRNNEETSQKADIFFMNSLKASPCVELWSFYLTHVRRLNSSATQRDIVRKSYEYALNHIGQDKESGLIWHDYIQFLKADKARTTWEEQQKMDSLRKVYHRAVQIPLDNVECLWQDLETFETNLSRTAAKKLMADLSPVHMRARTVHRQLTSHLNLLYAPHASEEFYLPSLPKFDAVERALVGRWKAYLKWEEQNPLKVEESVLNKRLMLVYRKAIIQMRYYNEIWFMAYTWAHSVGKYDEAKGFLTSGLEANPSSYLLTFAYVEALEVKKEFTEVQAVYEKFLGVLRANLDTLEKGNTRDTSLLPQQDVLPSSSVILSEERSSLSDSDISPSSSENAKAMELQKHRTEYGLAWVMYMRFARRAEGVRSSRTVFAKARKDRWTPWQVFDAAALMEYHCSDETAVAVRIFEKGLEIHGKEIDFVRRYLVFLISLNDEKSARALFDKAIPNFSPDLGRPLWELWARYVFHYGSLEAALNLEKLMGDVYPTDPPIKRLAQRHIYLGIDAIANRDLGFAFTHHSGFGRTVDRSKNVQSQHSQHPTTQPLKRPASPNHRKRDDAYSGTRDGGEYEYASGSHKRVRVGSPSGRGSDRDTGGMRNGSPRRSPPFPVPASWNREERGRSRGGRSDGGGHRDNKITHRPASIPSILNWFIGELPTAASFDGPIFKTEDLMNLFRGTLIPSTTSTKPKPSYRPL